MRTARAGPPPRLHAPPTRPAAAPSRPPQAQESPYIKHAVQLEQWLMEGAYNNVRAPHRTLCVCVRVCVRACVCGSGWFAGRTSHCTRLGFPNLGAPIHARSSSPPPPL